MPTSYPPQNIAQIIPPEPQIRPAEGLSVFRIEQYGLPEGYLTTVTLEMITVVGFTPSNIATYPPHIQAVLYKRSYTFSNQKVIQVELPVGGISQIGWRVKVQPSVSTPVKEYLFTKYTGIQEGADGIIGVEGKLYNIGLCYDNANPTVKPHVDLPLEPDIRYIDVTTVSNARNEYDLVPQFIPATPVPVVNVPLTNSGIQLVQPFTPPEGTVVANAVADMYQYLVNTNPLKWVYNVGKPPIVNPVEISIVNKTVNAKLRINITLPNYLTINVPTQFILSEGQVIDISVSLKETYVKDLSILKDKNFKELIAIAVFPVNVTGPVYVGQVTTVTTPPPTVPPVVTVPTTPTIVSPRLFIALSPSDISMRPNVNQPIDLQVYFGPDDGAVFNSTLLQFPPNSVIWNVDSTSIAYLTTEFSNHRATINGLKSGDTKFSAEIVGLPSNISESDWKLAYSKIQGANISKTSRGILIKGSIKIIESQIGSGPSGNQNSGGGSSGVPSNPYLL